MTGRYASLASFLAAQPPATTAVTLTLGEITAIIGKPLPSGAFTSLWWSNTGTTVRRRAWVGAGWRVAGTRLRIEQPTVTFTRAA